MMNQLMELVTIVVSIVAATFGVTFIIKTVFDELDHYRRERTKPFEKSLNKLLDTCSEGVVSMMDAVKKTTEPKNVKYEDFTNDDDDYSLK